ncbi:MAG: amidohydrolase [Armatimonadetes bacterium]|nr:amidohydrolase [Armatimonadota bacterium]
MTLLNNFLWAFDGSPQEMLIEHGRVVWRRGPSPERPEGAQVQDLGGQLLMPAFIDAHCHFLPTGLDLLKLNLGGCGTRDEVLARLRDWERNMEPGKWLHAVHYDQTRFSDGVHLTRWDLDRVIPSRPVLLRHVSGHASVANTAALQAAGVPDGAPDPKGGSFGRDASGRLDGTLFERVHEEVTAGAPDPSFEEMVQGILLAGKRMKELGIACATDMMTGRFGLAQELDAYEEAVKRGCEARVRLYPVWSAVFGGRGMGDEALRERTRHWNADLIKLCGVKIFADGAVGAGTAAIYGRYVASELSPPPTPSSVSAGAKTKEGAPESPTPTPPSVSAGAKTKGGASGTSTPLPTPPIASLQGEGAQTSGQLLYAPERLNEMVRTAHSSGFRIAIHSIGDYATDLVMDVLEATGEPSRHRIEHAMLLSDSQIERLAGLGCHVSMQPEFLIRFAHAYKRQLGPERASKIKRMRSVVDAGIALSLSSDRPIVSGDPWVGVRCASDRPEGFDPAENLTRMEALLGYTQKAAEANEDGGRMGSLSEGQLADWIVCEGDSR